MKQTFRLLDFVRYGAAGGIFASAIANIAFNPSQSWNVVAAIIGAILTVVLVKHRHIVGRMWSIDGNTTDIATLVVAAVYALTRAVTQRDRRPFIEGLVSDLSYGVSIYPMILLTCVAFSSNALNVLAQSNKVLMSLAGFFSLVVILKRSFEPRGSRDMGFSRY